MSQNSTASPPGHEPSYKALRWSLVVVFLVIEFTLAVLGIKGAIPPSEVREVPAYSPWSDEVVDVAAQIPVQDGGRIKPFLTLARFRMMTYHGSLTMKVETGGTVHNIGPVEWFLDVLFRPDLADDLPIFRLDDAEILRPFGIQTKDRRARLSFNDLKEGGTPEEDGFQQLINRGRELLEKREEEGEDSLSKKEKKVVDFAQLVLNYTGIRDSLDILRGGLPALDPGQLAYVNQEIYDLLKTRMSPSQFSFWLPILRDALQSTRRMESPAAREFEFEMNRQLTFAKYGPVWIPPQEGEAEEWLTVGGKVDKFFKGELKDPVVMAKDLQTLETIARSAKRPAGEEFLKELTTWKDDLRERAGERGEGAKVETEVSYYRINWFKYGLVFLIAAFLVSAVGWILRKGIFGWIVVISSALLYLAGTSAVLGGLIHRYLITGRPPVSNLYDTIPFITAGALIVLGISELLTRRRILLSLGAALGAAGLFFAFSFELGDAKDNMDPLRAVLDSNYWLATHVVTITIGYCGGLVACFLSMVYVHLALAGVMKQPKAFHRFMTRTAYGITCFTLFFALIGTVLGGIWANDSWGRFWGWDPKENGALLIVLWSLIILHARLAGWMKGWGIHIMSILGGSVVVFSWWGVNMLGVGLHSYGFTEGASNVYYFYLATVAASLVGLTAWIVERTAKAEKRGPNPSPPALPVAPKS